MLRALFFDADDTLYEEKSAKIAGETAVAVRVAELCGRDPVSVFSLFQDAKETILTSQRGDPLRIERSRWIVRLLQELDLHTDALVSVLEELYWERVNEHLSPYADAAYAIPLLAKRYPLIVVTNENGKRASLKLARTRFLPFFTAIVSATDVGVEKPDPGIFLAALALSKQSAEHVLMIGNDPRSDIAGANASGIRSVFLRRGPFSRHRFSRDGEAPCFVVSDYFDLLETVRGSSESSPLK